MCGPWRATSDARTCASRSSRLPGNPAARPTPTAPCASKPTTRRSPSDRPSASRTRAVRDIDFGPLFEALAETTSCRAARAPRRLRGRRLRGRAAGRIQGRHALRQGPAQEGRLVGEPLPAQARGAGARADRRRGGDGRASARAIPPPDRTRRPRRRPRSGREGRRAAPWLDEKRLQRFFTVPDPRQRELERLPYELYAAELSE